MEMRNTAVMDQLLTATPSGRANSRSNSKASDSSDFGSMVRQKQQDTRGNDAKATRTERGAQTSTAKPKSDTPAAQQESDVPDEQYAIAAAMMMQSWLQMIPFNTTPEENTLEVEITPEFLPDMHIEIQADAPLEQLQVRPEEVLLEARHETFRDVVQQVRAEVQDFSDRPVVEEQAEEVEEAVVVENVEVEAPVFGYMQAEPVKVASVQEAPVELEAPDGMEQLRGRIEEFLTDAEGNSYVELTLSPPELGKITVSLTQATDGALHIQLSASTVRAAELLERNTAGLQQLLASTSRPQVKVEMTETQQTPYIFINPNEDNGQNQQNRQQNQQKREQERGEHEDRDFIQQLRLGLVGLET